MLEIFFTYYLGIHLLLYILYTKKKINKNTFMFIISTQIVLYKFSYLYFMYSKKKFYVIKVTYKFKKKLTNCKLYIYRITYTRTHDARRHPQ